MSFLKTVNALFSEASGKKKVGRGMVFWFPISVFRNEYHVQYTSIYTDTQYNLLLLK